MKKADILEAQFFRANALRESGRLDEAIIAFRRVLDLKPEHIEGLNNLGTLLMNSGRVKEAVPLLRRALQLRPGSVEILANLGNACSLMGWSEKAIAILRQALKSKPDFYDIRLMLAQTLLLAGKHQEALECYQVLARQRPDASEPVIGQAQVLEEMAEYQQAYDLLKPLLKAGDADAVAIYFDISKHVGKREEAARALECILERERLHDRGTASVNFRLGKYYDETGDYNTAFNHFEKANSLIPTTFNQDGYTRYIDAVIATYSSEFVRQMPRSGNTSEKPVFIVGMPRSGTTLIEQILASHPEVFGGGELPHISNIVHQLEHDLAGQKYPHIAPALTEKTLDRVASHHLDVLQGLGKDATRTTDKVPYNFTKIGLIAQLFPRARIIHCTRHPLDTCLSCYMANFGTTGNEFSYRLESIGVFFAQYHRLMQHWEQVFDNRILRVSYAELVQHQERVSRQLVKFCGLEWNAACLDFHKTDRFANTMSYDQVRQPIYTKSLGRWRNYEQHLRPLRQVLKDNGISYE